MKGLHGLHELGGWPEDLRRARRFWGIVAQLRITL